VDRHRLTTAAGIALLHLLLVAALLAGTSRQDWLAFALVYPWAAIGVGVGMHRYFSHRAFRTSRPFQFSLALMASLAFGNALFFAGKHRLHHRHSDAPGDVHSPAQGWWQCWVGSLLDCGYTRAEIEAEIGDYMAYPELQFLYRNPRLPGIALSLALYLVGGFGMMVLGGLFSGIALLHQSSAVNYFCHRHGARRFRTRDDSTNNAVVAMLSWGEGWHNNHHRFPRSARAGLRWWEFDPYYWVICLFEALGLVWGVRRPEPATIEAAAPA
jgi:stearoyl-CoA desaturase (delta-9 desaturase)